jgi:hypothetical protein
MILDKNTQEMIIMSTMTPTEFAATVDSDGRTVRKFLRSITPKDDQPGKGSRWELPAGKREVTKLTKQFKEWSAKQADEKAARAAEKAAEANSEVDEVDDSELDA